MLTKNELPECRREKYGILSKSSECALLTSNNDFFNPVDFCSMYKISFNISVILRIRKYFKDRKFKVSFINLRLELVYNVSFLSIKKCS